MTEPQRRRRRILVAVDTSEASRAALEAAARLAKARGAELVGVYVEENDVVDSASFPFSQVLGSQSAGWRNVDSATMMRALRARATRLRREMARAGERYGVTWSFRTARGALGEALGHESRGAELVALGRSGGLRTRGNPLGRGARSTVGRLRTSVLLLGPGPRGPQPLVVVYEGSERVLETASEIARAYGQPLWVAALASERGAARELAQQATAWIRDRGVPAVEPPLVATDADSLAQHLSDEHVSLAVVDTSGPIASAVDLDAWLDRLDRPAFLVR